MRSKIGSALRWLALHVDDDPPPPHPHYAPTLEVHGVDVMVLTRSGWVNLKFVHDRLAHSIPLRELRIPRDDS